jgi:single-strand DNA-binding protein
MLNQVQIIGHLGKDPETRHLPSGEAVANFSIATTEKWRDKQTGEQKEHTEWHNISTFGRLSEIVGQYLHKGSLVYVSGKLKTRKYQKDGQDHYATSIQCQELKMLGGKPSTSGQGQSQSNQNQQKGGRFEDMDDDIPF